MQEAVRPLEEEAKWRSREVNYWAGKWSQIAKLIPSFELTDFVVSGSDSINPYLKTVVRTPRTTYEQAIPVGVVSNNYSLAQHHDVVEKCLEGIRLAGLNAEDLNCEVGLSALGEWMNCRIYFPEQYNFSPTLDDTMKLRLECFNSVEGSSRLIILLGWLRMVCSNGLIIRETKTELRDVHGKYLDIEKIPNIVSESLQFVRSDTRQMWAWYNKPVKRWTIIAKWADEFVAVKWGKKAACRVYHICMSGYDVEIAKPFVAGKATEKPVIKGGKVPGAPDRARNLYDLSQALSWIASKRSNAEERLDWQGDIPMLIRDMEDLMRSQQ